MKKKFIPLFSLILLTITISSAQAFVCYDMSGAGDNGGSSATSQSAACGLANNASGNLSSAYGYGSTASGVRSASYGNINSATGDYSSATGYNNAASGNGSTAMGNSNTASQFNSIAIGISNNSTGGAPAIGISNNTSGSDSSAVGVSNYATGVESAAIGNNNDANALRSSALGISNSAGGNYSTASGYRNTAYGVSSSALGQSNFARGDYSSAIGSGSYASGLRSIAMGNNQNNFITPYLGAQGIDSIAIGTGSYANQTSSIALGTSATSTLANSVAIGANSTATDLHTGAYTISGGNIAATTSPGGVVSVGSSGNERQIQNVGAGVVSATSTDAVNGSQLYAVGSQVGTNAAKVDNLQGQVNILSAGYLGQQQDISALRQGVQRGYEGTAVALATAGGNYLQENQKFSVTGKFGSFRGQYGMGAVAQARLNQSIVAHAGIGGGVRYGGVGAFGGLTVGW